MKIIAATATPPKASMAGLAAARGRNRPHGKFQHPINGQSGAVNLVIFLSIGFDHAQSAQVSAINVEVPVSADPDAMRWRLLRRMAAMPTGMTIIV